MCRGPRRQKPTRTRRRRTTRAELNERILEGAPVVDTSTTSLVTGLRYGYKDKPSPTVRLACGLLADILERQGDFLVHITHQWVNLDGNLKSIPRISHLPKSIALQDRLKTGNKQRGWQPEEQEILIACVKAHKSNNTAQLTAQISNKLRQWASDNKVIPLKCIDGQEMSLYIFRGSTTRPA